MPCAHSAEQLWPYLWQVDLYNRAGVSSAVAYDYPIDVCLAVKDSLDCIFVLGRYDLAGSQPRKSSCDGTVQITFARQSQPMSSSSRLT